MLGVHQLSFRASNAKQSSIKLVHVGQEACMAGAQLRLAMLQGWAGSQRGV